MKVVLVALVLAALMAMFVLGTAGTISGAEAKQLVSSGAMLIDVRTPSEFSSGHIQGAVNIPVTQIDARLPDLGEKSDPIVLYCHSGARSARAKRILERAGFTSVSNLGAMSRWD